jgi:hypothetical protein
MLYMTYNVIFTSVPIVVFAALERDVSDDSLMRFPELYHFDGRRSRTHGILFLLRRSFAISLCRW